MGTLTMPDEIAKADIFALLARLWRLLPARRRRQFLLLLGLMLVSAFAEVVSLGAILPFLAVITTPGKVFSYKLVASAAAACGITEAGQLVLPLTVAFAVVSLGAGLIRILVLWASTRLTASSGSELSIEVYRRTLYQPYQVHIASNSSEVINGITNKVNGVVFGVVLPMLALLSSALVLVAVMAALLAIDPLVATIATAGFGASYALITLFYRRRLRRNSARIAREQTQVLKALQEGLGGIRDVLLDGAQPVYCEIYRKADVPFRLAQGDNSFVGQGPRYAIEAVGMVLITVLAFGLSRQPGGVAAAFPVLGALALGAQRLLPALQQIYNAWTSMAGNQVQLSDVVEILERPIPPEALQPVPAPLAFVRELRFEKVSFRYAPGGPLVLSGLDVSIPKGARVGLIGATGSGKSTAVDLLMGLLLPTGGRILVDGTPLADAGIKAWQRTIAHVPQSIYLADASLAENIAFGVPPPAVDMALVKRAARQAQIADFIESGPEGYDAVAGERGVRLSGGQRQRIGIARALYKRASVLILDEATSALDSATEQAVMDSIDALKGGLTVIMIAHRVTTLKRCDFILQLDAGRLLAKGTYDEMLARNPDFLKSAQGTPAAAREEADGN
ncbi:MAG: ABC transporter ATP-binding protein [Elusimicrobia bacterium]|nr:ABC transporter ATP-binding protein [Elusimicrobiota bacterium]